jgi:flagellar protein FlaG
MNEVSSTPASPRPVPVASSKGSVNVVATANGNELPKAVAAASNEEPKPALVTPRESGDVDHAVTSMNNYVQSIHRDLEFSVDEELDRTVIKVVDSVSGELIRQIPEEAFLDLARRLREDGEIKLIDALG